MPGPERGEAYRPEAGMMLLGEALGEHEAREGKPFVGPAGFVVQQLLDRGGWQRDSFLIENSLRCRPPHNALAGEPYELAALTKCRTHLRSTIAADQPKVIVALGGTALMSATGMPWRPGLDDYLGYPIVGPESIPILPTWHPAYILRGKWNLSGIWRWHLRLAEQIAQQGYHPQWPETIVDPSPIEFNLWVDGYEQALRNDPRTVLAYDIETEHSAGRVEDEFDLGHASYLILRISFAYRNGQGLSVRWAPEYFPGIRRLLASEGEKAGWNLNYDDPRIERNGIPIKGQRTDLMWAWHSYESDVPRGLGFVTPLLLPSIPRWKHLSGENPGFYSAVDGAVTHDLHAEIFRLLKEEGLSQHHERHVIHLAPVLRGMSAAGVPISDERRRSAAAELMADMARIRTDLRAAIPRELIRLDPPAGFVRTPTDTTDLVQLTVEAPRKRCLACGALDVTKTEHTSRKTLPFQGTRVPNPCYAEEIVTVTLPTQRWAREVPWVPSNKNLQAYAAHRGHRMIMFEGKPTFDDDALGRLRKRYPNDLVYPLTETWRELEKTLGTNVGIPLPDGSWEGGMPVASDGKVHTSYNHKPSTARLASTNPNLQNIPHRDPRFSQMVRSLFIPEPGCTIVEIDYSAIEAVLVGYFALDPTYVRMAKLGVHDFFNSHLLRRDGKISEHVTPDWSDADLRSIFADLKKRFKAEREVAKRCVHSGNYGISFNELSRKFPKEFPRPTDAGAAMGAYFELFPSIPRWQHHTIAMAARDGQLTTPFGNRHRFWKCYNWDRTWDDAQGKFIWKKEWADDAKRALAFIPQSTAAGIIKDAMLNLSDQIRQYLRMQIHDSLLFHVPTAQAEGVIQEASAVMMAPNPCLPLPPEWGMGEFLSIGVEVKQSDRSWAECH
jgi:uracil-DNA glycosylase family 4